MGDLNRVRAALTVALHTPGDAAMVNTAVARVGAASLPGDGGAVTLMTSDLLRETLATTDQVAAGIEQAQYLVGEGPSLDALAQARPVLTSDLFDQQPQRAWPGLLDQLRGLPVQALFAFPMRLGAAVVGVALFYRRVVGDLDRADLAFALQATDMLTAALIQQHAEPGLDGDGDWLGDGLPGNQSIHQATGMLMIQLGGVTAITAFARLRGYAFAAGQNMDQVAADIIAGTVTLPPEDPEPT